MRHRAGDVVVIEPGEAHPLLSNALDYVHFVLKIAGRTYDKVSVKRPFLGL